jgi:hypothetical protein
MLCSLYSTKLMQIVLESDGRVMTVQLSGGRREKQMWSLWSSSNKSWRMLVPKISELQNT